MDFKKTIVNPEEVSRTTQKKILKGFAIFLAVWVIWAIGRGGTPNIEQYRNRIIYLNEQINTLDAERKILEVKIDEFITPLNQSYDYNPNTDSDNTTARSKPTRSIIPRVFAADNDKPAVEEMSYDIGKLAGAVALAETNDCKLGAGFHYNNCFGIMQFGKDGSRWYKRYNTHAESYEDFKRIWTTWYKKFPDYNLAHKWTGNDHPDTWLANVTHFYNTL